MPRPPEKIGLLFGIEDSFPWALMHAINSRSDGTIECVPVELSFLKDTQLYEYALIVDRISHEVPFYRTFLKSAAAHGVAVVNNPFWWSADDKYFGNLVARSVDVATPRTVLLPHKRHPPGTEATSFRNLRFVDWDAVFAYLGFPIFLKPAYGGGWKDVYRCTDAAEFFAAYDQTRDLCMMAQEAIEFTDYYRCYVVGRARVHIMRYDPKRPHAERYLSDAAPPPPELEERMRRDALALCDALGYDMNTVEFAIREHTPYAIDFTNPAPDAELTSVGRRNFDWMVSNMAETLIDRVRRPLAFEATGRWPQIMVPERAGQLR
jgi:glutathione synthase/RimK-type ligase-like ATP-grasp enzyme